MDYKIAVVAGDGIGPEITNAARRVLETIGGKFGHIFHFTDACAGGIAIDTHGEPMPAVSLRECLDADSVLLGAVGGPKWDNLPGGKRAEQALFDLRAGLGAYANLRPAVMFPALASASPLRADLVARGFDILIVRELTGGIYFGERGRTTDAQTAYDVEKYSAYEIERIGRRGFEAARARKKRLCSVDKANVLETSRLWREVMHRLATQYPDVEYSDMLVDNAAMQLVRNPAQFDVIVTSNLFGDILSDEASQLTGSIGMLASASLGDSKKGLYEPIHGSAPDIAGKDVANPIATILSAAMMLRMSFGRGREADAIESAVNAVLEAGWRTPDIASAGTPSDNMVGTRRMTELVCAAL